MQGDSAALFGRSALFATSVNRKPSSSLWQNRSNADINPQRGLVQHSIRVLWGARSRREIARGEVGAYRRTRRCPDGERRRKQIRRAHRAPRAGIGRRLAARMARGAAAVRAGGGGRPSIGSRYAAHETRASDARAAARSETHHPLRSGASAAGNRLDRGVGSEISRAAPGRLLRHRLPPHHADGGDAAPDPPPVCGKGSAALRLSRIVLRLPGAGARPARGRSSAARPRDSRASRQRRESRRGARRPFDRHHDGIYTDGRSADEHPHGRSGSGRHELSCPERVARCLGPATDGEPRVGPARRVRVELRCARSARARNHGRARRGRSCAVLLSGEEMDRRLRGGAWRPGHGRVCRRHRRELRIHPRAHLRRVSDFSASSWMLRAMRRPPRGSRRTRAGLPCASSAPTRNP